MSDASFSRSMQGWVLRREELLLLALMVPGVALAATVGGVLTVGPLFVEYARFILSQCLVLYLVVGSFAFALKRLTRGVGGRTGAALQCALGERRCAKDLLLTLLELLRGVAVFALALGVYSNLKVRIPLINDVIGDPLFARLDAALFGGLPARLEAWARDDAGVARWLGNVYLGGYRGILILALFLVIRFQARHLRVLFLSMACTYLVCVFVTIAYPSLGPCFVEPDRFAWLAGTEIGQHQSALMELRQDLFEQARVGSRFRPEPYAGIAAFPSLHVGNMVVVLFVAVRYCRVAAPFVAYYLVAIAVAATSFGWHYVIDYVGGAAIAVAVTGLVDFLTPLAKAGVPEGEQPEAVEADEHRAALVPENGEG